MDKLYYYMTNSVKTKEKWIKNHLDKELSDAERFYSEIIKNVQGIRFRWKRKKNW